MKQNFGKRGICAGVLAVIMAVCVVLGICFLLPKTSSVYADEIFSHTDTGHSDHDWKTLSDTGNLTGGEDYSKMVYYKLESNVTLSSSGLTISSGYICICLNGFALIYNDSGNNASVITVSDDATLYLCDCGGTTGQTYYFYENDGSYTYCGTTDSCGNQHSHTSVTGGIITGGNGSVYSGSYYAGGGIYVSGTLNMYGGTIAGNNVNFYCGGVYVGGTFNMYGGAISYNSSGNNYVGGVYVGGTFYMFDGEISNNTAAYYAGVEVDGKFYMYGGSIKDNNTTDTYSPYSINVQNGTFEMHGGTINEGHDIYLYNATLQMSGGAVIGGHVSVGIGGDSSSTFIMTGGYLERAVTNTGSNTITVTGGFIGSEAKNALESISGAIPADYTIVKTAADNWYAVVPSSLSSGHTHSEDNDLSDTTFATILTGYELSLTAGSYYLTSDVSFEGTVSLAGTIYLCLNGYKFTGTGSSSVLGVESGATLYLCDCNGSSGEHDYYVSSSGLSVFDDGTYAWDIAYAAADQKGTISGGVITGGGGTTGAGICVTGALYMYSGTIAGNATATEGRGGGVYVNGGSFTMEGGSITHNVATRSGGGVFMSGESTASFTMNGGSISYNAANVESTYGGGGIYAQGTFILNNGEIYGNVTRGNGGGVFVSGGTATLTGGCVYSNTATNGGGIFGYSGNTIVYSGYVDGTFARSSGTISISGGYFTTDVSDYLANNTYSLSTVEVTLSGVIYTKHVVHTTTVDSTVVTFDSVLTEEGGTLESGNYYLNKNVKLTTDITINGTVYLCLNGYALIYTGTDYASVITISSNATLYLCDCNSSESTHYLYTDSNKYYYCDTATGTDSCSSSHSSHVEIEGGIITGGTGTSYIGTYAQIYGMMGGGIYISSNANLNMYGGTIAGNMTPGSSDQEGGGGVYVGVNANFTMYSGAVSYNYDGAGYGGVEVYGGTFNMWGGTIEHNYAAHYCGGVYVYNNGTFNMYGGAITDNDAEYSKNGLSVYVSRSTFNMHGGMLGDSSSTTTDQHVYGYINAYLNIYGGYINGKMSGENALYYKVMGGYFTQTIESSYLAEGYSTQTVNVSYNDVSYTIQVYEYQHSHSTAVSDGYTATASETTVLTESGGSLGENGTIKYYFLAYDVTLKNNITITAGTVYLCLNGYVLTGAGNGSVISVSSGATLILCDCNGSAGKHYYHITSYKYVFCDYGTMDSTCTNNDHSNYIEGGVITGGILSSGAGGGVSVDSSTLYMYGGTIAGNGRGNSGTAYYGGGVYVTKGSFTMSGGSICGNYMSYGGGVAITNGTSFTMSGTAAIYGNTAQSIGGGVYMAGNSSSITMSGTAAIYCNSAQSRGGGIYMLSGTFTMDGDSAIYDNEVGASGEGGGVYVTGEYSKFYMKGGSIYSNTAVKAGGVYIINQATFEMSDGSIYNNISTGSTSESNGGGGVYVAGRSTFKMTGGSIYSNSAENYGGGVFIYNSTFNMSDSAAIYGNSAEAYGGGVYVYGANSEFTMSGGTIGNEDSHNTAERGGGVYIYNSAKFTMSDSASVSHNTATMGGGVFVYSATFTMEGGTISYNVANGSSGGGVYAIDVTTFDMKGGTISHNTASYYGGGVYVMAYTTTSTFTMSGTVEITNNTATYLYGGGVYVAGTSDTTTVTFTMSDGTISGNNAVGTYGYGGGVLVGSYATFIMSGGEITGNRAKDGGGVEVWSNGTFTMSDTAIISGNTATSASSAVDVYYGTFNVNGGYLIGSVYNTYGAVYVKDGHLDGTIQIYTYGNAAYGTICISGGYLTKTTTDSVSSDWLTDGSNTYVIVKNYADASYPYRVLQNATHSCSSGVSSWVSNSSQILGTNSTVTSGTYYFYLAANTYLDEALYIPNGAAVYLCLNGYALILDGAESVVVSVNGTFYLCDCNGSTTHYFYESDGSYIYCGTNDSCGSGHSHVSVSGGVITGGNNGNGGGVYVAGNAVFTMYSGTIAGNSAVNGGGVYVYSSGTFTMSGGEISYNTASGNGGGIITINGNAQVNVSGTAKITHNSAANGGGVYVMQNSVFTMSDGEISYNTTSGKGGGVYFSNTKTMTFSGGIISNNTANGGYGGGVYADVSTYGTFNMSGNAKLYSNSATNGGGVYVASGAFAMSGGYMGANDVTAAGGASVSITGGYFASDDLEKYVDDDYTMVDLRDFDGSDPSRIDSGYEDGYYYAVYSASVTAETVSDFEYTGTSGYTSEFDIQKGDTYAYVVYYYNGELTDADNLPVNASNEAYSVTVYAIKKVDGSISVVIKTYEVTVSPKTITVVWNRDDSVMSDYSETYNGTGWTITATASTGIEGQYVTVSVSVVTGPDLVDGKIVTAGTYTITAGISNVDGGSPTDYTLTNGEITFTVARQSVTKPTEDATTHTYNGNSHTYTPTNYDTATMAISNNVQMNANENGYTVTVSLKDTTNYMWADNTDTALEFAFIIYKATPDVTDVQVSGTYYTSSKLGDVELTYTSGVNGTIKLQGDSDALITSGTYTWVFTPEDTNNYKTVTDTISIEAVQVALQSITVSGADGTTFEALYMFSSSDIIVTGINNDSSEVLIDSGYTISISGQEDLILHYGTDGKVSVTVTYGELQGTLEVYVTRIVLTVPTAVSDLTYSGKVQTGVKEGVGYTLTDNTGKDADSYKATATLVSTDYVWENSESASVIIEWNIATLDISHAAITLETAEFTYSGEEQSVKVVSVYVDGVEVTGYTLSGDISATEVGTYTLTVTGTGNFTGKAEVKWSIVGDDDEEEAVVPGDEPEAEGGGETPEGGDEAQTGPTYLAHYVMWACIAAEIIIGGIIIVIVAFRRRKENRY